MWEAFPMATKGIMDAIAVSYSDLVKPYMVYNEALHDLYN